VVNENCVQFIAMCLKLNSKFQFNSSLHTQLNYKKICGVRNSIYTDCAAMLNLQNTITSLLM